MVLPSSLTDYTEWLFSGPLGPEIPSQFSMHPTVAVDGGAHFSPHIDVWVGDADSYQEEVKSDVKFKHPVDKDKSDLALALSLFKKSAPYKFHLWGFLGERKDHELFNLGECLKFLDNHPGSEILFYRANGDVEFHLLGLGLWGFEHQGTFSLGTLRKTQVELTGECEFPITPPSYLYPLSSFGLSNRAQGLIKLNTEGSIFIYFPEKS